MARIRTVNRRRDAVLIDIIASHGYSGIGHYVGRTPQAVFQWTRVPTEHVIALEALTGIPRERLRPDIYGAPRPRPRRAADVAA